jgi:hypothetical protein
MFLQNLSKESGMGKMIESILCGDGVPTLFTEEMDGKEE